MSNQDDAWESLQGFRILLVEDDPLICLDLESSLSDLGAVVSPASNVSEALEILKSATLDFAVLDFELGSETSEPVARAARKRQIPFLYLSGYSERDERFATWPEVAVLAKPISATTIARHIRQALNKNL